MLIAVVAWASLTSCGKPAKSGAASPSGTGGTSGSAAGSGASAGSSGGLGGAGAGCGTESFAAIYQSILSNPNYSCKGPLCHGRDASMLSSVGNLSMASAQTTYEQLVNVTSNSTARKDKTRVVPGDAKNSLLLQKLRGDTTTCGAPMPINADQISDAELKRITDWVNAGACNN